MNKTLVMFGAATALATRVAHTYGVRGYEVLLVGPTALSLQALSGALEDHGLQPRSFIGELAEPEHVGALMKAILGSVGHIDALYYAPAPRTGQTPACALRLDQAQEACDLLFLSLVAMLGEVLPAMRSRRSGEILVALEPYQEEGRPFLCGAAPALAAARSYLQSLQGELSREGVQVRLLGNDVALPAGQDAFATPGTRPGARPFAERHA